MVKYPPTEEKRWRESNEDGLNRVNEWFSEVVILPVPLQAFSAAPFTVWTWRIATLPVSAKNSDRRERKEEKQTWHGEWWPTEWQNWNEWCVWEPQTEPLVWFWWFCESQLDEKCTFHKLCLPKPAAMLQERKRFQAREVREFKQALSRESRCSRIREGFSLRTQIFTGKWKENCADHTICVTPSSTGRALCYGTGFRGKSRRESRSDIPVFLRGHKFY